MSNNEACRNLSRRLPTPADIQEIMKNLEGETDRLVAIVACAIVEAALERLMTAKLTTANKSLVGQLFSSQRPLSNFNAKIRIAQAFGIITPSLGAEIRSIRSIRNTFAYAKVPMFFGEAAVATEVAQLKLVNAIKPALPIDASNKLVGKYKFLLTIELILIILDCLERNLGTAGEALAAALRE